jgi:hypothetical protein
MLVPAKERSHDQTKVEPREYQKKFKYQTINVHKKFIEKIDNYNFSIIDYKFAINKRCTSEVKE